MILCKKVLADYKKSIIFIEIIKTRTNEKKKRK